MTAKRRSEVDLGVLGLREVEELVFRAGLRKALVSIDDISRDLGISTDESGEILAALEARGLMTRAPGKTTRYRSSPPGPALGALVRRQQEQLDRVLLEAERLDGLYRERSTRKSPTELLEVLESPDVVAQRALQMVRSSETELLTFDKPPYSLSAETNDPVIEQALERGVRVRAVYDHEAIELDGGLDSVRRFAQLGEEARVMSQLPFKLNISDRRAALLPLAVEQSGIEGALLIHSPHLVEALALLWQILWDRAIPIGQLRDSSSGSVDLGDVQLSEEDRRVVDLLLAGAKSAAIARQLGVALSTVERKIKRLMEALGAETRFQAGFQLARRLREPGLS